VLAAVVYGDEDGVNLTDGQLRSREAAVVHEARERQLLQVEGVRDDTTRGVCPQDLDDHVVVRLQHRFDVRWVLTQLLDEALRLGTESRDKGAG
jgi:hypothetical protein